MCVKAAVRHWMLVSCLAIGFLAVPAQAVERSGGSVNLVATLKDGPAMRPVDWKIYRTDNNSIIESTRSHSLNLPLSPGTYKAVATLNNVSRNRTFTVNNSGQVNIVIAMD